MLVIRLPTLKNGGFYVQEYGVFYALNRNSNALSMNKIPPVWKNSLRKNQSWLTVFLHGARYVEDYSHQKKPLSLLIMISIDGELFAPNMPDVCLKMPSLVRVLKWELWAQAHAHAERFGPAFFFLSFNVGTEGICINTANEVFVISYGKAWYSSVYDDFWI